MSAVAHRTQKAANFCASADSNAYGVFVHRAPSIGGLFRRAVVSVARVFARAFAGVSEANMQRALIETELYRNRCKHASKNDDDLPVIR